MNLCHRFLYVDNGRCMRWPTDHRLIWYIPCLQHIRICIRNRKWRKQKKLLSNRHCCDTEFKINWKFVEDIRLTCSSSSSPLYVWMAYTRPTRTVCSLGIPDSLSLLLSSSLPLSSSLSSSLSISAKTLIGKQKNEIKIKCRTTYIVLLIIFFSCVRRTKKKMKFAISVLVNEFRVCRLDGECSIYDWTFINRDIIGAYLLWEIRLT